MGFLFLLFLRGVILFCMRCGIGQSHLKILGEISKDKFYIDKQRDKFGALLKSLQTLFHIIILRKRSNMRYYQRSILMGVLVSHLISSTLSLYATENIPHGRGYRDQEREIGVLQYSQEQNNNDSMYEDFDNIKPEKLSTGNDIGTIIIAIVVLILLAIIVIVCICCCPNLFDFAYCCCNLGELFSLCLPNTN